MKVHPIAALFPMMSEQELQELAADIQTNGLTHAIVLDGDDQLVDGRNRLRACEIANIEPRFERLNGADPVAFILSSNIARRHMTAGQRAMLVAKIYPESEKGGRGKKSVAATGFPMVNAGSLSHARTVIIHASDLVDGVIAGNPTLEDAYRQACARRELASSNDAKMQRLRNGAADLADLVVEGRMQLDEALAAMNERERKTRELIEDGRRAARDGLTEFLANTASIVMAAQLGATDLIDQKRVDEIVDAALKLKAFFSKEGSQNG